LNIAKIDNKLIGCRFGCRFFLIQPYLNLSSLIALFPRTFDFTTKVTKKEKPQKGVL
jgi:hypothetical protein